MRKREEGRGRETSVQESEELGRGNSCLTPRSDRVLLRSVPFDSSLVHRDPTAAISAREFAQERGRKEEWRGKLGEGREKRSLALAETLW